MIDAAAVGDLANVEPWRRNSTPPFSLDEPPREADLAAWAGRLAKTEPATTMGGMFELDAQAFLGSVTEIRRLCTVLEMDLPGADELFVGAQRQPVANTLSSLCQHLLSVGAQSAWVAADRLAKQLASADANISFGQLKIALRDVESRFADHLSFIKLYVLRNDQLPLLGTPAELLGTETAERFTSVWFDCEEAAKCLVLLRPTAAVFHSMRMLEAAIKALSARLGIPDPVKPAQRNWAFFLKAIRTRIDEVHPTASRLPGSEGAFLDSLYATLDAVKNPWRNETMHVEGVYTDAEARFILTCVSNLVQQMAARFDEDGADVAAS